MPEFTEPLGVEGGSLPALTQEELDRVIDNAIETASRDNGSWLHNIWICSLELAVKAEGSKRIADTYASHSKTAEFHSDRIKESIKAGLERANLAGITAGPLTLNVRPNGGNQAVVITGDVPEYYMRVKKEPDKAAIGKALKEGEILSFAHLDSRGTRIEGSPI